MPDSRTTDATRSYAENLETVKPEGDLVAKKAAPHQFSPDTRTLGVEEEFLLCGPHTGRPSLRNSDVAAVGQELGLTLQLELSRCQIEPPHPSAPTSVICVINCVDHVP